MVTMERIATSVWLMRGGFPDRVMNVYFIEEPGGGVTVFDAGIQTMARAVAHVGKKMGGIKRILLGHAHGDHRGAARAVAAPVWCHEDDVQYAEAEDPEPYFDFSPLPVAKPAGRYTMPFLLHTVWDGGPVRIERTVKEGDRVAGFDVVHFPGHAPGMIGLWRERDRLALASDTFYTIDPTTGEDGAPRIPHPGLNQDREQAGQSLRKLAALEPAVAWGGHGQPVTGEVRAQLETAAATT